MYREFANGLYLEVGGTTGIATEQNSCAEQLSGQSTVDLQVTVQTLTGATSPSLTVTLETSQDGVNWRLDTAATVTLTGTAGPLGPTLLYATNPAVSASHVRLHYSLTGTGATTMFSAGLGISRN